jgi:hypothetical protein
MASTVRGLCDVCLVVTMRTERLRMPCYGQFTAADQNEQRCVCNVCWFDLASLEIGL